MPWPIRETTGRADHVAPVRTRRRHRFALRVVGPPLRFPGKGDSVLVEKVRPHVTGNDDWLRGAHRLHGGALIRPVDILRALAVATRPRYEGSVYDVYASWAVLRYIGVFDSRAKGLVACRRGWQADLREPAVGDGRRPPTPQRSARCRKRSRGLAEAFVEQLLGLLGDVRASGTARAEERRRPCSA